MHTTLLVLHAAHHEAVGFDQIMWGAPQQGKMGRAMKALAYMRHHPQVFLYVGCGSLAPGAPVISEMVYNMMIERGREVPGFESSTKGQLEKFLEGRYFLDRDAQTTTDEIARAAILCGQKGLQEFISLSSPTHSPRCWRDTLAFRELPRSPLAGVNVSAIASDTNFADSCAADVVVFEPPHRKDRHRVRIDRAVKKLFKRTGSQEMAEKLEKVLLGIANDDLFDRIVKMVA